MQLPGVGVDCSDSCRYRGGWWGTGCPRVRGNGRLVLLNHLSKPFGKVEVCPDGDEALCRGSEKGVYLFPH